MTYYWVWFAALDGLSLFIFKLISDPHLIFYVCPLHPSAYTVIFPWRSRVYVGMNDIGHLL